MVFFNLLQQFFKNSRTHTSSHEFSKKSSHTPKFPNFFPKTPSTNSLKLGKGPNTALLIYAILENPSPFFNYPTASTIFLQSPPTILQKPTSNNFPKTPSTNCPQSPHPPKKARPPQKKHAESGKKFLPFRENPFSIGTMEQSRAEQSRAEQSRAEQSRAEQSRNLLPAISRWDPWPYFGLVSRPLFSPLFVGPL
jgi:hypothetical protein